MFNEILTYKNRKKAVKIVKNGIGIIVWKVTDLSSWPEIILFKDYPNYMNLPEDVRNGTVQEKYEKFWQGIKNA